VLVAFGAGNVASLERAGIPGVLITDWRAVPAAA
jgi:hypothetical protein